MVVRIGPVEPGHLGNAVEAKVDVLHTLESFYAFDGLQVVVVELHSLNFVFEVYHAVQVLVT